MITRDDLTFSEQLLGREENICSYKLHTMLFIEHHTVVERYQGKPPNTSDFDSSAKAIMRDLYLEIFQDLSIGIQLLHNDPTQARATLNTLHTKLQNALNS